MSKYKPFSAQIRECTETGNLVKEECHNCGHTLLMCKKYGGQCISSKCRDKRMKPEPPPGRILKEGEDPRGLGSVFAKHKDLGSDLGG